MMIEVPHRAGRSLTIAYHVFDDVHCVFTSLTKASEGASINHAEAIITAIAKTESREINSLRFYDLQTQHSYGIGDSKPNPGDFEFDELILEPGHPGGQQGFSRACSVDRWQQTHCPEVVLREFGKILGSPAQQVLRGNVQESAF